MLLEVARFARQLQQLQQLPQVSHGSEERHEERPARFMPRNAPRKERKKKCQYRCDRQVGIWNYHIASCPGRLRLSIVERQTDSFPPRYSQLRLSIPFPPLLPVGKRYQVTTRKIKHVIHPGVHVNHGDPLFVNHPLPSSRYRTNAPSSLRPAPGGLLACRRLAFRAVMGLLRQLLASQTEKLNGKNITCMKVTGIAA